MAVGTHPVLTQTQRPHAGCRAASRCTPGRSRAPVGSVLAVPTLVRRVPDAAEAMTP